MDGDMPNNLLSLKQNKSKKANHLKPYICLQQNTCVSSLLINTSSVKSPGKEFSISLDFGNIQTKKSL